MAPIDQTTSFGVVLKAQHLAGGKHQRLLITAPCAIGDHLFKLKVYSRDEKLAVDLQLSGPRNSEAPPGRTLRHQQGPQDVTLLNVELAVESEKSAGPGTQRSHKTYYRRRAYNPWTFPKQGHCIPFPTTCKLEKLRKEHDEGRQVSVRMSARVPETAAPAAVKMSDVACLQSGRTAAKPFNLVPSLDAADSFSDCILRAGSLGPAQQCHRMVLAAASEPFKAAFSSGCAEAAQKELVLQDTQPQVLELLLQHVYGCSELQVPLPLLLPLLSLADQWRVSGLCADISTWLEAANVSTGAAAVLLPQAHAYNLAATDHSPLPELAQQLIAMLGADHSRISKLSSWQVRDMALLLTEAQGLFAAFEAAAHWVQQQAAAEAAGRETAATTTATATGGEASISQGPAKRRRTAASIRAATAAPPQATAIPDSNAAWALLLPLVQFGSFTEDQLRAVRHVPGADSIPGLQEKLLAAWEGAPDSGSNSSSDADGE